MSQLKQINTIIKKEISSLTLPSAIHLIGRHLALFYPEKNSEELYAHVKFSANPSLSFPKSEISNIYFREINKRVEVELELNFLSLFGSGTPLPIHYAETTKEDYGEEQVLLDFLNLFNHHLQKFIYLIWKDARYYVSYQKDLKDKQSKQMLSILGLYPESQEKEHELDFNKLLPFLGMLSLKQKSSGTLASIMRHYIGHDAITIDECVLSRANIPEWQKKSLGDSEAILGESFICGDFVTVSNLKFRINLHDIPWHYLKDFSLFGSKIHELKDLVGFTLNEPLGFEIALHINEQNIKDCSLHEDSDVMLGVNSWVGEPSGCTTIIIEPSGA
ncbi:MAG TPA: type VI secretion system baseplate subunit TssG [Campylobacterales bacterium]|nr:type VI secretion system baseplate subunit TssG [Campylobacterales bacterium]